MKKIILTVMSLAFLSSAANIFAKGDKIVKVINNTDNDITLQNAVDIKNQLPFTPGKFRNIDTIEKHTTKPITFSTTTADNNPMRYRFPDTNQSKSFYAASISGNKIIFNEKDITLN